MRRPLKKIVFTLALIGAAVWGGHWWYYNKVLGFSTAKISSNLSYNVRWAAEEPQLEELEQIFSQPYSYLKSGTQSYAFVSQDGKYVMKFFRFNHLSHHWWDIMRPEKVKKKQENLEKLFGAYKLAYECMKDDAGLLYVHLNKTSHLKRKIEVKDKHGRLFWIDLDQTSFCVQEKAELIFDHLKKILERGDREALQGAIQEMKNLIARRHQKGISDDDHAVTNNFGFVGDRAIQIDIGRLYQDSMSNDEERIAQRLDQWLHDND